MITRGRGKNLRRFHKSCDIHCLETGPSLRKKRGFERERVRFEGDATAALSVGIEIFYTLKIHQ
jgi:hypothetical protein